jgi:adenosylhomocysteinase
MRRKRAFPPLPWNAGVRPELWAKLGKSENRVYVLATHLDEKVAPLHLDKLGVKLTSPSAAQADYLGLPSAGPFKPEHCRY